MDPGLAAHRKSAAQHPGNAFLILMGRVRSRSALRDELVLDLAET